MQNVLSSLLPECMRNAIDSIIGVFFMPSMLRLNATPITVSMERAAQPSFQPSVNNYAS